MSYRYIVKGLLIIASFVAIGFLLRFGQEMVSDTHWIDEQVVHHGLNGVLLFVFSGALFIAVGLPRQMIAFLAGYAFDVWLGTIYGVIAAGAGCAIAFVYARFVGRALIARKLASRVHKWDAFVSEHPFSLTLLIRLLPVGSNLLTNLVAGLSRIPMMIFVSASTLGYIPQTLIFALIGSGIKVDPVTRITIGVALFVLSAVLAVSLYRKHKARTRAKLAEVDEELEVS